MLDFAVYGLNINIRYKQLLTHVKKQIQLEMCSYGQLSEVQMLRDLDLDLENQFKVMSTYTVRVGLPAGPTT